MRRQQKMMASGTKFHHTGLGNAIEKLRGEAQVAIATSSVYHAGDRSLGIAGDFGKP